MGRAALYIYIGGEEEERGDRGGVELTISGAERKKPVVPPCGLGQPGGSPAMCMRGAQGRTGGLAGKEEEMDG